MLAQILFLVIFQTILASPDSKPYYDVENVEVTRSYFENFIKIHSKNYDVVEKQKRFEIFVESLKEINRLNQEQDLATFDINFFADMTVEERKKYRGFKRADPSDSQNGDCKVTGDPTSKQAPDSWDWRTKNVVTPVKNQQTCGSCWAFSATALVESRIAAKYGKMVSLSEQQMVDCDEKSFNCNGGLPTLGLTKVMKQGGQELDSDYPYKAEFDSCQFNNSKVAARVTGCTAHRLSSEDALKELLYQEGPVSIAIYSHQWHFYSGGIFRDCAAQQMDHAVLLVGYGTEKGVDYWTIKNSWGKEYGEQGYIRIRRGVNCNGIGNGDPLAYVTATVA